MYIYIYIYLAKRRGLIVIGKEKLAIDQTYMRIQTLAPRIDQTYMRIQTLAPRISISNQIL
jgi:hypothetical protein